MKTEIYLTLEEH